MFNCDGCKKTIGPGIQPTLVTTMVRYREYPKRTYKRKDTPIYDKGGSTFKEIVCQEKHCPACTINSINISPKLVN